MNDPALAHKRAAPKSAALILWSALQLGVLIFLGIAVTMVKVVVGHPLMPGSFQLIDDAFPVIAAVPVVIGFVFWWRHIGSGPREDDRVVRLVREKLLAAGDPGRVADDIVNLLEQRYRGSSILAWAMGEGGALLAVIFTMLRGLHVEGITVVALWYLSMGISVPTPARIDRYRRRALRAAGLDDAQIEQLLARASR